MRWWTRSTQALHTALRNLLSPTFGVDAASEPVLARLLRAQERGRPMTARRAVVLLLAGAAVTLLLMLLLQAALSMPPLDSTLWLVVFIRLFFDWPVLSRALGRLTPEMVSGRWDMLRLTTQSEGALLRSYRAATGASVWPLTLALIGAQTAALVAGLGWLFGQFGASAAEFAVTGAALVLVFGAELFYRRRAMIAVGLAISAEASRGSTAAMFGGLALLLWWIGQGAAVLAGVLAFGSLLGFFAIVWPGLHGIWWTGSGILLIVLHGFVERVALVRLAQSVAQRAISS